MDPKDEVTDIYEFISFYGFLTLSIAMALGISFNNVIEKLTEEMLYPLLGTLFNIKNIKNLHFVVNGKKIKFGKVLMALLSYFVLIFLIVIFAYYIFGYITHRMRKIDTRLDRKTYEEQKKTNKILDEILDETNKIPYGSYASF